MISAIIFYITWFNQPKQSGIMDNIRRAHFLIQSVNAAVHAVVTSTEWRREVIQKLLPDSNQCAIIIQVCIHAHGR